MSDAATPVPTYPAHRLGDPSEEANWNDLPRPYRGHLTHVEHAKDNSHRASWAAAALKPYGELVMGDPSTEEVSTVLADLLADLRHLGDAMGVDFEDAYAKGCANYYLDLRGEQP